MAGARRGARGEARSERRQADRRRRRRRAARAGGREGGARASTRRAGGARGGISRWDASGIFQDLAVAEDEAGAPSARTLLLLYAADLAFRLRWEIRPALAEGRTVVAAPYVDTAIAFGRAAGLPADWLANLFRFAPRPSERHVVAARGTNAAAVKDGFVGFASAHVAGKGAHARQVLITATESAPSPRPASATSGHAAVGRRVAQRREQVNGLSHRCLLGDDDRDLAPEVEAERGQRQAADHHASRRRSA